MKPEYDVVVIGAGSGGLTTAVGFSKVGKSVLLVEREHFGGECTNTGCIPSKALLHHAKTFHTAQRIAGTTTASETYRTEAFAYVRSVIDDILSDETPETFERLGITVVMGEASFVGSDAVKVGATTYRFGRAVIATGSAPRLIDVPGLAPEHILTNQNLFNLEHIPERTLVVGTGPIGLEMGQALALLGSQVTLATIDSEFGRLEDPAIRPKLRALFADLDVPIHLNAFINYVEGTEAVFDVKENDTLVDTLRVPFEKVLLAIGRVPNLPAGLDTAGITATEHGVRVDGQHRTSNRRVYALGDVADRLKFTHMADDIARQVVAHATSRGFLRVDRSKAVPKVTYTEPEVAQVGLSWAAACERFGEDRLMRVEVSFSEIDRAKTDAATDGVLVVVARRLSGTVLGAHLIGPRAGEIVSLFTLAIDHKLSLWKLQKLIYAYPTYSVIVKKAGDQFVARQIGNLKTDLIASLRRHLPKLLLGGLWIALLIALYRYQSMNDMTVTETALSIFDFISLTAWGPLLYILAYTVRPITFFPGTALTILSGVFFGLWFGILYTVIAANLSATVAYLVGRFFGGDLKLEETTLGNWIKALQHNPFEAVLTTRLIFLPFDLVSYAAGILKLPLLSFVGATAVGTLLGIATFVSIGASLDVEAFRESGFSTDIIDASFIALSAVVFVVSIGVSKLMKRSRAGQPDTATD